MSRWGNQQRARECAAQLDIATDAVRRATLALGLLQDQLAEMPDDLDAPDEAEPIGHTYVDGP